MLHPREFEKILKELNPRLNIRRYYSKKGFNDGIYYANKYLFAVHSGYMYPQKIEEHINWLGVRHRSLEGVFDRLFRMHYIKYRDRWKLIK